MNNNILEGEWDTVKAKLKKQWADLTDDDLLKIKSDNQKIFGILEKKYGQAKDEVKDKVKETFDSISSGESGLQEQLHELKSNFDELKKQFTDQMSNAAEKIPKVVKEGQEKIAHSVESHPFSTIGLAAVAGFILGAFFTNKSE